MVVEQKIQVRFFTRETQHALPETIIHVPIHLKRAGLSEIVNHLLAYEKSITFEFLIDGKFLKTSIQNYLDAHSLSAENILDIEYVEAFKPPVKLASFGHDDWISAVKIHSGASLIVLGGYDGVAKVLDYSGQDIAKIAHDTHVKSVAWVDGAGNFLTVFMKDSENLVTGCGDGSIFAYHINKDTKEHRLLYECSGHDDSVNALAVNSLSTQLASAGNDMMIHLYNVYSEEGENEVESIKGHKRRKVLSIPKKTPVSSLEGHSDKITSICYSKTEDQVLYSGGYDHSVRCWDLEKKDNIITMNCEKVTLSLDHCSSGLLASGHVDNIIRLWDPRAQEGKLVKMQLKSHTNWVSSVAWSPSNKFVLASASYDGNIKLWDIRSTSAFCTLEQKESNSKLLTMDWSESMIVAGGEGKTLDIHQYSV